MNFFVSLRISHSFLFRFNFHYTLLSLFESAKVCVNTITPVIYDDMPFLCLWRQKMYLYLYLDLDLYLYQIIYDQRKIMGNQII